MAANSYRKLLERDMSRKEFLTFGVLTIAGLFGIAGILRQLLSHAQTATGSGEAENGTTNAPATVVNDSTASGGKAVKFGPPVTGGFVLGTTRPDATNTGLNVLGLTTADLTVVNGDLTINDAYISSGGKLDRLWVKGHIIFTATSAHTVTNSLIQGRTFTGAAPWDAIVHARSTSTPTTARISFTNCKITCIQPNVNITCAAGERLGAFYRCDMSLGSDIIDYWATGCPPDVKGCYLHDYTFWANDSKHTNDATHPGWSHNDAIQYPGGVWSSSGGIIGNNIAMYANPSYGDYSTLTAWSTYGAYGACIILTTTNANHVGVKIQNNWFRGAERQIQMQDSGKGFGSGNSWDCSGNRHSPDTHGYNSGPYSHHMYDWLVISGMADSNCHNNVYDTISTVPSAIRGTALPAARTSGNAKVVDFSSPNQSFA